MKPKDRQARILDIVSREGEVTVEALAELFDLSLETVRRDLQALAETGALHKVRGGARRIRLTAEGTYRERMVERAGEKAEIGRKLSRIIEDGETIFMDTGTTTLACADALAERAGLTVITNSLRVAQRLGEQAAGHRLFLLGGEYGADNSQTTGPLAIRQIGNFRADRAVLTVTALDAESGAMDADFGEAQVARAMIENARNTTVLADSGKFGRRAAFGICRLDEIDVLVSEARPDAPLAAALGAAGVVVQ